MDFQEIVKDYWEKISSAPINVAVALFVSFLLIKPMFQVSIFSGLLYIGTMIFIFGWKVELLVDNPRYVVVVYVILAIRAAIGTIWKDSWGFLGRGEFLTAFIFIAVWAMIYLETRRLQRH